jgi:NADH:ubiquinone oxidoreductase subunit E
MRSALIYIYWNLREAKIKRTKEDFMLNIRVCVGSACFLRGADNVIVEIEQLIRHYMLDDLVAFKGYFCMDNCNEGVTMKIGDKVFKGVSSEEVTDLFEREVFSAIYEVEKSLSG